MHPLPLVHSHTYFVLGLGQSGQTTLRALLAAGAKVYAWDDSEKKRNKLTQEKDLSPVVFENPEDWTNEQWQSLNALILSPGIPHTYPKPHPLVALAKKQGCPLWSDIELLIQNTPEAQIIAITGTNGKSTTTALIAHLLQNAGVNVSVGGNLGPAVLGLPPQTKDGFYLFECSSYQLEITPSLKPRIAALLNITPDHLERHGGLEGYKKAKQRIFNNQDEKDTAIFVTEDPLTIETAHAIEKPVKIEISTKKGSPYSYTTDHIFLPALSGQEAQEVDLRSIPSLRGQHNAQNAIVAISVTDSLNLDRSKTLRTLKTFPGLPHRQEQVAKKDSILFINDSKASNAEAAAKALGCYTNIYWIAGGLAKEEGIGPLKGLFPRIARAFLIGQDAPRFEATLTPSVPCTLSETLEQALLDAFLCAQADGLKDPVILLSPAAASFDQFTSFEARGNSFIKETLSLDPHVLLSETRKEAFL